MVRANTDTPWKKLLDVYFPDCIAFFMPLLWEAIDWTKTPVFLDKELDQLTKDSETGKRIVDKLVKVYLKEGRETYVLLAHLEVQGKKESNFEERLYIYHNRIFDKHRCPIVTMTILTDSTKSWRPICYESRYFGCEISFKFPMIKLLDYEEQEELLLKNDNPFAFVVLAHLALIKARRVQGVQEDTKYQYKLELTWHLYRLAKKLGRNKDFVRNLVTFLDWVLSLSPELELEYIQEIEQIEEEFKMTYIPSFERRAHEEGLQQGLQQGRQQGLHQGETQVLLDQMACKFSFVPDDCRARVVKADEQHVRMWLRNILKANTLDEVFKETKH